VLSDTALSPWLDWLLDRLQPSRVAVSRSLPVLSGAGGNGQRRYALGALRCAVMRVVTAAEGTRNSTLNAECFALARFIPDLLSSREVAHALTNAALAAGLAPTETEKTLISALRAGGAA
jgi:hypothetical protein